FLIGLASSLMGISGGSLVTMVLTLYGRPIHRAVATAAGVGVPITMAGTFGYILAGLPHQAMLPPLSIGFVSVIGVALIAPISSFVAPFGARLAHRLSRRRLEIGFGVFLLIVSARFILSLTA
ncbi:MAG TPA: sulfite exporter TauE/SafE family protein, partial [Stellaceae bacterium]|nr:sulfite exporter TauE/SafE family protein [Stellaceae bacterium]